MTISYSDSQSVFVECLRRGVRLDVDPEGRLVPCDLKAALDADLAGDIERHKPALAALLSEREARKGARPEVDPAVASFYPGGVPQYLNDAVLDVVYRLDENNKPLGDAAAAVMDRLYKAGRLVHCDDPETVRMRCPTCGQPSVIVCEGMDGGAWVVVTCDCGLTRLLQVLKGIKATLYYWPATRDARAVQTACCLCGGNDWWLTAHGTKICRVCHPPAHPSLEQKLEA